MQQPYGVVANIIPALQMRRWKDKGLIAKGHLVINGGAGLRPRSLWSPHAHHWSWLFTHDLRRLRADFESHCPCWCPTSPIQRFSLS